jgi:hypothetical protein
LICALVVFRLGVLSPLHVVDTRLLALLSAANCTQFRLCPTLPLLTSGSLVQFVRGCSHRFELASSAPCELKLARSVLLLQHGQLDQELRGNRCVRCWPFFVVLLLCLSLRKFSTLPIVFPFVLFPRLASVVRTCHVKLIHQPRWLVLQSSCTVSITFSRTSLTRPVVLSTCLYLHPACMLLVASLLALGVACSSLSARLDSWLA